MIPARLAAHCLADILRGRVRALEAKSSGRKPPPPHVRQSRLKTIADLDEQGRRLAAFRASDEAKSLAIQHWDVFGVLCGIAASSPEATREWKELYPTLPEFSGGLDFVEMLRFACTNEPAE